MIDEEREIQEMHDEQCARTDEELAEVMYRRQARLLSDATNAGLVDIWAGLAASVGEARWDGNDPVCRAVREEMAERGILDASFRRPTSPEYHCAHCSEDITVAGKPDSGGSCPVCKGLLCRHCAGGWC